MLGEVWVTRGVGGTPGRGHHPMAGVSGGCNSAGGWVSRYLHPLCRHRPSPRTLSRGQTPIPSGFLTSHGTSPPPSTASSPRHVTKVTKLWSRPEGEDFPSLDVSSSPREVPLGGGFGPLRAQETTSRMGPSDPLRKRYLRWRSGWNLAANDPVKLGSGRGNASTRALRRFLVFSLLITAKKAGPFPSHKSCGGVSPVCPTLGSRRFPALLPRRTNRGGKPPGSAGLPRVFSTRLKLSKRFHALLSPDIKIQRFALNS